MKRKWLFYTFVVCISYHVNAQDYLISFTGTGASTTVATVKVKNLTAGTTLNLYGNMILRLIDSGQIHSTGNKQNAIRIYPNPVAKDNTVLQIHPPSSGNTIIRVFDSTGKIVAQTQTFLGNYTQEFRLSGLNNGFYIINLKGNGYHSSAKLLWNNPGNGHVRLVKISDSNPADEIISETGFNEIQDTVNMLYSNGDRLMFKGISGKYSTLIMDIPTGNKTIAFPFLECSDKNDNNYTVVEIGSQIWMAENLMTTLYDDGTAISYPGNNDYSWNQLTNGAYAWYENNEGANKSTYGALYNWLAVNSGILCPAGWHVPTDHDWMELRDYLGGTNAAGNKVKDAGTAYWDSPNKQSTNESGFSALPGGMRNGSGFSDLRIGGQWWSSTFYQNWMKPSYWYLNSNSEILGENIAGSANDGFSVRCLLGQYGIAIPFVLTNEIKDISLNSAIGSAMVTSDEGAPITALGVCWSSSGNPTVENDKAYATTDKGSYTGTITGLMPGTTYHVRAFATNSAGTAYGDDLSFTTLVALPVLSTVAVTSINQTSAISGGNITNDGGGRITIRGICWATTASPTINDSKFENGAGTGSFTGSITGLLPGTAYHVRAYATNSAGTAYGNDLAFTTDAAFSVLTTSAVANVSQTSALAGGNITSDGGGNITARGVCWAMNPSPTISDDKTTNGNGTGSFTSNIAGLLPGTTYHVRAYATNSAGTAYGNDLTFTTLVALPVLSTLAVTTITQISSVSGGNITNDGGGSITTRGICWATTASPTINDSKFENGAGTGSFTGNITGLLPGTAYHVRAYATNSAGTAYGNDLAFTTDAAFSVLTTSAVANVSQTSALAGGNITSDGGGNITARGVCWAMNPSPTISDDKTTNGNGTGSFTSNIAGLLPGTTYHVRAYATNSAGTAYGDDLTFTTLVALPVLSTLAVTTITQISSVSGGNITNDGGGNITTRGICWAITASPTLNDSRFENGAGTGSFTGNITGLLPGTTYHVRAYATNSTGTAYGNDLAFTTLTDLPVLTTSAVTNISQTTATTGGNVTDDGGKNITERGICWATTPSPTINDDKTTNGNGTGSFTSTITGLMLGTTYHVRAFATNSAGTAYGNDLAFTTLTDLPVLTTSAVTNISQTTATTGGNITDDGGKTITVRGICWATTPSPTINDSKFESGAGTGSFTGNISGLQPGTTYYVRAYAINSAGTAYGNQVSFSTNPVTPPVVTFNLPTNGKLLHSTGDKRIIYTTVGSDSYIKYSDDDGVSYNQGVRVTNIFAADNKARILGNGNIVLFCVNRIYYSDDNMTTIKSCNVLNKDGSLYAYHTPVNSNYPGGYFNFMDGFVENAGVCLLGNYTNSGTGASPVNLYYSLDGITWKVAYTFGQNPNRTDNGTSSGGVGGNPLGDPDNPILTRHIHGVNIGEDGNFYVCTGDVNQEMHFLKCSYNSAADTWDINDLLTGESRNWQRMRAIGVYERNGYLYWGSDGPGIFTYKGVTYECEGIYKCAVYAINDPSQHILVEPLQDACYSFLNVGHLVFAGLQNDTSIYISFDHGETWTAFAKPPWMTEEVEGVWLNELHKFFVTRTGVIISSTSF